MKTPHSLHLLIAAALIATPAIAQESAESTTTTDTTTAETQPSTDSESSSASAEDVSESAVSEDEATASSDQIVGAPSEEAGQVTEDPVTEEPGTMAEEPSTVGRTETEAPEFREERGVNGAPIQLLPQAGVMGFDNANETYDSRFVTGLTLDWSTVPGLSDSTGGTLGLSTGFLFSHIGSPQANFVGNSDSGEINTNANVWMIPMQLMAGINFTDSFAIRGRLGTHLVHRSVNSSMLIGREDLTAISSTEFLPSVGLTAGLGIGKNIGLTLRGDYVPTPARDVYLATLGLLIPLG